MADWVNHVAIAAPRNGTTSHTVSPASGTVVAGSTFTPTAGSRLVAICYGSVTSGSTTGVPANAPTGWTKPANGEAVNNGGLYVWHKVAAGSDTVVINHNSSNYPVLVEFFEFPAGSTVDAVAQASNVASGGNNPSLSGLTTSNLILRAAGKCETSTGTNQAATWASTTELVDTAAPLASSTDGYHYTLAYHTGFSGSSAATVAATLAGGTGANTERLTIAITAASAGNAGILSTPVPRVAASIAGTQVNSGTPSASVPKVTASIAGTATNSGTLSAPLPLATASITGEIVEEEPDTFRLFDETAPPTEAVGSGSGRTVGLEVIADEQCWVTKVGFWQPTTDADSSTRTVGVFTDWGDRTLLGSATVTPSGDGWQWATLSPPIELEEGERYTLAVYHPAGRWAQTEWYFSGGDGSSNVDHGAITVPSEANASGGSQGLYGSGEPSLAFPYDWAFASNFWIDAEFTTVEPVAEDNLGDLSATLPVLTASITGGQVDPGTLSASLPKLTGSISGTASNPGTTTTTVPRLAASVTASQTNPGTLSVPAPLVTSTITGVSRNPATLSGSSPKATSSIAGTVVNPAALSAAVLRLAASVVGTQVTAASLAADVPIVTASIAGSSKNSGSLSAALPKLIGFVADDEFIFGTITTTLSLMAASIAGTQKNSGSLSATLSLLSTEIGDQQVFNAGTLVTSVPKVTLSVTGAQRNAGSLSTVMPRLATLVPGVQVNSGSLVGALPTLVAALSAGASVNPGSLSGALSLPTAAVLGQSRNPAALAAEVPAVVATISGMQVNPASLTAACPLLAAFLFVGGVDADLSIGQPQGHPFAVAHPLTHQFQVGQPSGSSFWIGPPSLERP